MNRDKSLLGVCQVGFSPTSFQLTAESLQRRKKVEYVSHVLQQHIPGLDVGQYLTVLKTCYLRCFKKNDTFSSTVERTYIPPLTLLFSTLENTGLYCCMEVLCWLAGPTIPYLTILQVLWTNFARAYAGDVTQQSDAIIASLLLLPQH